MAESHLLFRFWASAGEKEGGTSERCQLPEKTINLFMSLRSKGSVGISPEILCDKEELSADKQKH